MEYLLYTTILVLLIIIIIQLNTIKFDLSMQKDEIKNLKSLMSKMHSTRDSKEADVVEHKKQYGSAGDVQRVEEVQEPSKIADRSIPSACANDLRAPSMAANVVEPEATSKNETADSEPRSVVAPPQPIQNQKINDKPKRKRDYEKIIGGNIFSKLGILVLILGIGFFIKFAIDNNWINETIRIILGYFLGGVMIALSQKIYKNYPKYSSVLAGGGFGLIYLTTALAYHLYALFPYPVAFVVLILTTVAMISMSIVSRRKELSIMAIVGGFIAPFILGGEASSYIPLLTYIAILNVAMFVISLKQRWEELHLICMTFTAVLLIIALFDLDPMNKGVEMIGFISLFYLLYFTTTMRMHFSPQKKLFKQINLIAFMANNVMFLAMINIVLSSLEFDRYIHGISPLVVAVVNYAGLFLTQKNRKSKRASIIRTSMLGTVISSITVSVPFYFNISVTGLVWTLGMVTLLRLHLKTKGVIFAIFAALVGIVSLATNLHAYSQDSYNISNLLILLVSATGYLGAALLIQFNKGKLIDSELYNLINTALIFISILTYILAISKIGNVLWSNTAEFCIMFGFINVVIALLTLRFRVQRYINLYLFTYLALIIYYILMSWSYISDSFYIYALMLVLVSGSLFFLARPFVKDKSYLLESYQTKVVSYFITMYIVFNSITATWMIHQGLSPLWSISIVTITLASSQVFVGLRYKSRLLRIVGIAGFGVVLAKLVIYDIWQMSSSWKIISFIALGLILLILSFLYQKQDKKIRK